MLPVPHRSVVGELGLLLWRCLCWGAASHTPCSPSGLCASAWASDSAGAEPSHQVKSSRLISQVASFLVNTL